MPFTEICIEKDAALKIFDKAGYPSPITNSVIRYYELKRSKSTYST